MRKIKLLIAILLLSNIISEAQDPQWEILGEMPNPVSQAKAIVFGEKIYILGGYDAKTQAPVDWIQEYDPNTNTWDIVGHMLEARQGLVAGATDTSIIFFGGIDKDSPNKYNIEEWKIGDSISTVLNTDNNFNRKYPAGNYYNGSFYIFGGVPQSQATLNDTLEYKYYTEYNLASNTFPRSEFFIYDENNFPSEQISILFGNNIYIFGGIYNGILKKIYRYNVSTNAFDELSIQLSKPRTGGAAVRIILFEQIYIIGGYDEANKALSTVDVLKPDPGSEYIVQGPELNHARKYLMAAFYKGDIYVLGGEDANGSIISSVEKLSNQIVVGINNENQKNLPDNFSLSQNYPNPFNPSTVISYQVPQNSFVNLKIFDVLGNEVKELINENKQPGYYEVQFNAGDLTSGIYFYQLRAGSFSETKKMVVVK